MRRFSLTYDEVAEILGNTRQRISRLDEELRREDSECFPDENRKLKRRKAYRRRELEF